MSKPLKLTDAQIFTLRRMYNGTKYFMRGDKQKGEQDKLSHRVNCPSIAKAFYQFHKDTVKSCFTVFSDACAAAGVKVEAE